MHFIVALALAAALVRAVNHQPEGFVYRDHSILPPVTADADLSHWRMNGAAAIVDNVIRLTPDRQSMKGGVWTTRPWHKPTWEVGCVC